MVNIVERSILSLTIAIIINIFPYTNGNGYTELRNLSEQHKIPKSCTSAFCIDTSWPDPSTVQSLPVYGSAVAIDKDNNVVVLHRSTSMSQKDTSEFSDGSFERLIENDVIMVLDSKSGKILRTWGGGRKFARPHGLEISIDGSIFVTDVKMHQVFKYNMNTSSGTWLEHPELTLGEKFQRGNDQLHFCSPADVAIMLSTMDFFVADGYCNSRVVRFNRFGTYLNEFQAGSANSLSPTSFNVTHAVKIVRPCGKRDKRQEDQDQTVVVFVADRNNGRAQAFSENGSFLYEVGRRHEFGNLENGMLMSLDLLAMSDCDDEKGSATLKNQGNLFALSGHLPIGQAKVFEISVTFSSFQILRSFPVSPGEQDSIRIETPHDIAIAKDGKVVYTIDATDRLVLKKFVRNELYRYSVSNKSSKIFSNEKAFKFCLIFTFTLISMLLESFCG